MQKNVKIYLVFCLICLQIVVPFIHAHAFGHDSFKEHSFHLHTDEIGNSNNLNSSLNQANHADNDQLGAVTTVANGNRTSLADDISIIAIFFTLALLVFSTVSRFTTHTTQFLRPQHHLYSLQNPRAPPR